MGVSWRQEGFGKRKVQATGNTCGAVTGALIVIGMKYGRTTSDDVAAKDKTYAMAQAFLAEFKHRHQLLNCTELIGYNLKNPEEYAQARAHNMFYKRCTRLVHDAGEILETVL